MAKNEAKKKLWQNATFSTILYNIDNKQRNWIKLNWYDKKQENKNNDILFVLLLRAFIHGNFAKLPKSGVVLFRFQL